MFRKVAGEWKYANDTWNSDMPAAVADSGKLVILFKVKDYDKWQAAWTEHGRAAMFAQHGAPAVTMLSSDGNPPQHALLVTVTDKNAFTTWATSPEGIAAKNEDGVLDDGFALLAPAP